MEETASSPFEALRLALATWKDEAEQQHTAFESHANGIRDALADAYATGTDEPPLSDAALEARAYVESIERERLLLEEAATETKAARDAAESRAHEAVARSERLEAETRELVEKTAALEASLEAERAAHVATRERLETVEAEAADARVANETRRGDLEAYIRASGEALRESEQGYEEAARAREQAEHDAETMSIAMRTLEVAHEQLEAAQAEMTDELGRVHERLENEQQRAAGYLLERNVLEGRLRDQQQAARALAQRTATLAAEHANERKRSEEALDGMSARVAQVRETLYAQAHALAQALRDRSALQERLHGADARIEALEAELGTATRERDQLTEAKAQDEAVIAEQLASLEDAQAHIAKLQRALGDEERERTELRARLTATEQQLGYRNLELASEREVREAAESWLEAAGSRTSALDEAVASLDRQLHESLAKADGLREQVGVLQREFVALADTIAEKAESYRALEAT